MLMSHRLPAAVLTCALRQHLLHGWACRHLMLLLLLLLAPCGPSASASAAQTH
jgi:hypothetical protein